MNNLPTVAVIMSTYNGERFIVEQIDSILKQTGVKISLYIRDDGSTDRTLEIIRQYGDQIELMIGGNVGVGNSFMEALYQIPDQYEYYCFADQDDIWLQDKVIQGVNKLMETTEPALYVSSQIIVNAKGEKIGIRAVKPESLNPLQIFSNNGLTGCTMIWNSSLQHLLREEKRRPSEAVLRKRIHDVWVAMVASVSGRIICDPTGHILYRQHENNVVGIETGATMLSTWMKKYKDPESRNGRSLFAQEITEKYGDKLDKEVYAKLSKCADYKKSFFKRISLMRDRDMYRFSGEKPILYRMKVLFGLL